MTDNPQANVLLAPLTTIAVGGPARWLWRWPDVASLQAGLGFAREQGLPFWLLGGGSNVLIADAGLPGVVLQPSGQAWQVEQQDGSGWTVRVDAGVAWDDWVAWSVGQGLGGLECLSGIPGVVGAAPIQNIGAYGQEVMDVIAAVEVLDTRDGSVTRWDAAACGFGYRDSVFKRTPRRWIVTCVWFTLRPDAIPCTRYAQVSQGLAGQNLPTGREGLQLVRELVLNLRRSKGMVVAADDPDSRSCGSFFVNPVVDAQSAESVRARFPGRSMPVWPGAGGQVKLSAAWLIENCGMRPGYGEGPVGLSSKHTLALVNRGGATMADILAFAQHVAGRVEAVCGVRLEREPVVLGL